MLTTRALRTLAALAVTAALAVADDGRPAPELVGWREAWSVPVGEKASLSFLTGENLLTVTKEGAVVVRDAGTGAVRRTLPTAVASPDGVSAANGILFVTGLDNQATAWHWVLHAYDLASGRPLWQYEAPASESGYRKVQAAGRAVVVYRWGGGLLSLDARTGGVQARADDMPGCDMVTSGTSRSVMLLTRCEHGRVQLASYDPRTLRKNWTRSITTRTPAADDGARLGYERAPDGYVIVKAYDERFPFAEDGTPLPVSHLPADDDGWSPPLEVGHHPDAPDRPGFDWNAAWPLPGFLISRDGDTARLGAFPLDRPLPHVFDFVGAASGLAFVQSGSRLTAFRPVYGRPAGPVALGGVAPGDWPDACSLLGPHDLAPGARPLPGRKSLGPLTPPKPVTCDWVSPDDDRGVVSLSVSWVSPDAGALFAAAAEQIKRHESFDYDPTTEGEGVFSYTAHGPGGTFGATLVNVGPVIVHLTSPSRLLQRLAAVRVRDNLMARYRPGEHVRPPARTGGWTRLADAGVRADPVVHGGVVYAGADDGLYALDAVTGRARWKSSWPAVPMLVGGVLYGARSDGVAALDAATGRMRWNRRFDARDIVIKADGVYSGVGFTHVIALDAATGRQRWRFRVPGALGNVAVAAGTVYVISQKGHVGGKQGLLSALDAKTGALRWRSRLGAANVTPAGYLTATGEAVFAVTGTKMIALDPATGKPRWRARFGDIVRYDPIVIGDTVYLGDLAGRTYALDTTSGQERWRLTTAGDSGFWNVVESRGTVYVGGQDLHALDPASGEERWSRPLTARVSVHEDTVFAQDEGGTLHALDAATGAPRWRFQTGGRFQTLPVVADDLVYVGSSNGNLYALRATDGTPGPNPAELDGPELGLASPGAKEGVAAGHSR